MTVYLRAAAYAARRISSALKGSIKQFGWLQTPCNLNFFCLKKLRVIPQPSEFQSQLVRTHEASLFKINLSFPSAGIVPWVF
jgi:hypothetical protein